MTPVSDPLESVNFWLPTNHRPHPVQKKNWKTLLTLNVDLSHIQQFNQTWIKDIDNEQSFKKNFPLHTDYMNLSYLLYKLIIPMLLKSNPDGETTNLTITIK